MENQDPIVIIGGGIGGLCAAVRLAVNNYPVILLDKNSTLGGKMSEYRQDGFRWDLGPTVLTMVDVFDELFRSSGKKLDEYIQLIPMDPITRYFYPNGNQLDIWRDLTRTLQGIEKINPNGVEQYLAFMAYAARQFRITKPIYPYGPPPSLLSLRKLNFRDLLKVDVFRDFNSAIGEFTNLNFLRQLFGRFATYLGADPFSAPAVLSVIAYVELGKGLWYPRGGIYSLAQALERLAIEKGVRILKNRKVSQIVIQDREVRGVILEDGSNFEASVVISNVDYATTYSTLLPQKPPYTWDLENYQKYPTSSSAFILLLGLEGRFSQMAHQNIIFSGQYHREFEQIFKLKIPPDDPTVYIAITSKNDSNHAPMYCENWFVMVNVPALDGIYDWGKQAIPYKNIVMDKLKKMGIDLDNKILVEKIITPVDLEQMTGAYKGSLYGLAYNDWQTAFRRPRPVPKTPEGLYFVGGTTHPGGGLPMVALSAKYVCDLIMAR